MARGTGDTEREQTVATRDQAPLLTAVILAKNEAANIAKCLRSLAGCGVSTVVLDSGSTDGTQAAAAAFPAVRVEGFRYVNHLQAYGELTAERSFATPWVMILDADMEVSGELLAEIEGAIRQDASDVIIAPVAMYVDGAPLRRGSLYPPKPLAYRRGQVYFVASGHGERLAPDVRTSTTHSELIHNDLKPYEAYLESQARYGRQLARRAASGDCRPRDRLRASTPLMGLVSAAYSLVLRGGVMSGRAGWVYALDRIIAGLIQYRVCCAARLLKAESSQGGIDPR